MLIVFDFNAHWYLGFVMHFKTLAVSNFEMRMLLGIIIIYL